MILSKISVGVMVSSHSVTSITDHLASSEFQLQIDGVA